MATFTHFDADGASRMVDVGSKAETVREAVASAEVHMNPDTLLRLRNLRFEKGNVLEVARLAGIMAAKKTADLIPLCHPLSLSSVTVDFQFPDSSTVKILATARVFARTGVEMEALVAVSLSALTVYDMCKSVDRGMSIHAVRLEHKTGGKSGDSHRTPPTAGPTGDHDGHSDTHRADG